MNSNRGFEFKVGQKFKLNRRWDAEFYKGSVVTIGTVRDVDEIDEPYDINHAEFGNGAFAIRGTHLRRGDATLIEDIPSVQPDELLKEMNEALSEVNKLIAEASQYGFNYNVGNWAESLFRSQQKTWNALSKYKELYGNG